MVATVEGQFRRELRGGSHEPAENFTSNLRREDPSKHY